MGFTTFAPAGVTMVLIGLVFDLEFVWSERRFELRFDPRLHRVHRRIPRACATGFCHHISMIARDNPPWELSVSVAVPARRLAPAPPAPPYWNHGQTPLQPGSTATG